MISLSNKKKGKRWWLCLCVSVCAWCACLCVAVSGQDGGLSAPRRLVSSGFSASLWRTDQHHPHQTGSAGHQGNRMGSLHNNGCRPVLPSLNGTLCLLLVVPLSAGSVRIWFQQSLGGVKVFRDSVREQRRPSDAHKPRTACKSNGISSLLRCS